MRKYRLSNEPKAEIVLCRSRVHSRMSLSDMASAGLLRCGRYPLLRACREDEPALRLQLARSCQPDASLPRFGYVRDERVLSHLPRTRMCEDRLWVDLLPVSMQATLPPQQSDAFLARLRRQGLA